MSDKLIYIPSDIPKMRGEKWKEMEWKDKTYKVSNLGRILLDDKLYYKLSDSDTVWLVAKCFVPNPDNKMYPKHNPYFKGTFRYYDMKWEGDPLTTDKGAI